MAKDREENREGRRDFLKLASLGTLVGGVSLVASGNAQADDMSGKSSDGYRETTHVKTYYDLSRF